MSIEEWIEARGRRKGGKFGIFHKPERKDWKKVRCTYCGTRILYIPKQDFDGTLTCTNQKCKKKFRIPSLDGFFKE